MMLLHSRCLKVFVRHLINGLLTCLLTYLKQCIHVELIHSVLITVVGFVVVFGSSGVLSRTAVGLNIELLSF